MAWVPVDHDPFAAAPAAAPAHAWVPVDHDPFAVTQDASPVSPTTKFGDFGEPLPGNAAAVAPAAPAAPGGPSIMDRMFPKYGVAASIANGMTFGALPNIEAGAVAGVHGLGHALGLTDDASMGDVYTKTLKDQQDARRGFRAEHPLVDPALEAVGGLATGGAAVRNGATLVGNIANEGASNLAKRVGAGMVEGGAYAGAAGGLGSEGDATERLKAAIRNAPLGAVLGGAAIPAMDYVLGPISDTVANIYRGIRQPEAQGQHLLVDRIMADSKTPAQLGDAQDAAIAAGQPEYRAIDASGKNTQKLMKRAAATPGPFRDEAQQTLDARQAGQTDRIGGFIDEASGVGGKSALTTEKGIEAQRGAAAAPAYDAAYQAPTPRGPVYDEMLGRQSVQGAMNTVKQMAAENQTPLTDVFTTVPNPNAKATQVLDGYGSDGQPVMKTQVENPTIDVPTMRGWDLIKRNLDTQVNSAYRSGDAAQRGLAPALQRTRDDLVANLRNDNPAYGKALDQYSDASSSLEHVQAGRDLAKAPSDITRAAFDQVPPAQTDLARVGATSEIRQKLGGPTGRGGVDSTQQFDNANAQSVLDRIAASPEARDKLGTPGLPSVRTGQLGREADMSATRRAMAGGSDTTENLSELPPKGILYGLGQLLTLHPIRGAAAMGEGIAQAASGLRPKSAATIGDYLMNADPDKIRSLAALFAQAQQRAAAPNVGLTLANDAFQSTRQQPTRGPR